MRISRVFVSIVCLLVATMPGSAVGQEQFKNTAPEVKPILVADDSQSLAQLELSTDKPLYFRGVDGAHVQVLPGRYDISLGSSDAIVLTSPANAAITIQGQPTSHEMKLRHAAVLSEATSADEVHLLVLMPDGSALDALGTYSGTVKRAVRTQLQTLNKNRVTTLARQRMRVVRPCSDIRLRDAWVVRNNRPTQNTGGIPGFKYWGKISRSGNTYIVRIPDAAFDVQNKGFLNHFSFESSHNILDTYHRGLTFLTGEQAWDASYIKGEEPGKAVYYPTCFLRIYAASGGDIGSERGHTTSYRSFVDNWVANTGKDGRYTLEVWYFNRNGGLSKYGNYEIKYQGCQPASDGKRCAG